MWKVRATSTEVLLRIQSHIGQQRRDRITSIEPEVTPKKIGYSSFFFWEQATLVEKNS